MRSLIAVLAVIITASAAGQRRDFELLSKELNESQSIWVQLPESYDSTSAYGILYVLDADGHFDYMTNYVNYLSKSFAKVIPPLIVVGVRSKSPAWRYKNFTPAGANNPSQGNADRFLAFLTNELMPSINSKFKTNDTRVLAGHSLAGLFALYSIYKSPKTFSHVIAASPSISYLDGKIIELYKSLPSQPVVKFFFSVAENDMNNYRSYGDRFKQQLESQGWKSWSYEVFPGTDHYSTAPGAFYKGLITVLK